MANPDFLTTREFADALGLNEETIRRRIRKNESEGNFAPESIENVGKGGRNIYRIHRRELPPAIAAEWSRAA